MMISPAEIRSALSAYKTVKKKSVASPYAAAAADSFTRSDGAEAFGSLAAALAADPFYRGDLVEQLGRQISEGQYHVPSDKIVDRLLMQLVVTAAA